LVVRIDVVAAIAHQAAGQDEFTEWEDRRQGMSGRKRRELFRVPGYEGGSTDQDRTNLLSGKSCEGHFEIAVGSGICNNELPVQHARRRL
jgi:hypothetical protein